MPLTVPCLKCKHRFEVPSKFAGQQVRCPACDHAMQLPSRKKILEKKQLRAGKKPALEEASSDDLLPLELIEEEAPTEVGGATALAEAAPEPTVACPHCEGVVSYEAHLAEQVVACPYCGGHLLMPRL